MQPTILVADDDESIRLLLTTLLEEAGYRTLAADNGKIAVDLAMEYRPDVAILDVMMPEMDGFAACRAIKADQRTVDTPVLLLTALAQTPAKVEGLDCGASDYITKPFVVNELLARVRTALVQKSRRDALAAEAMTDPLTGLVNRRGLEQQLDHYLAHGARSGEALSLLIFDADHFKAVNDTYGHDAGDVVLVALAQRARDAMRAQDVVGRFGGEEFMAILPGAGHDAALAAAERLRLHVHDGSVPTPAGPVSVTVSIGVATTYPGAERDRTGLIAAADRALYRAKDAGRNRVMHADGQGAVPVARAAPPEAANALLDALALVHADMARHSRDVADVCWEIGAALHLTAAERSRVALGGLLHDVGKLAVAPGALDVADPLTEYANEAVRAHVERGEKLLSGFPALVGVAPLVGAQLECWDGSGYPRGLRGEAIPLGSRIIAVAHAFDALRHADGAPGGADVAAVLRRRAGMQFDANVVEAALNLMR